MTLPIWYGCSEDDEPLVTDNKVEEIEGFKLSSFASKLIKWRLSEAGENYHIILHSHADNKLYDYDLKVNNSGAKPIFTMYIPDHKTLPDGEYDAVALNSDGTTIGPRMYFRTSKWWLRRSLRARENSNCVVKAHKKTPMRFRQKAISKISKLVFTKKVIQMASVSSLSRRQVLMCLLAVK